MQQFDPGGLSSPLTNSLLRAVTPRLIARPTDFLSLRFPGRRLRVSHLFIYCRNAKSSIIFQPKYFLICSLYFQ